MIYSVTLNPALDREYIVPELIPNVVLRANEVNIDFGGKGFNVSRVLAALNTANTALGFVGGKTGQVLMDGLEASGIATDFIRIGKETRTNTTIVQMNGGDHFKVNDPGPSITPRELEALLEKISGLLKEDDWWVLAGSLPPGIPDDIYGKMVNMIRSAGAKAVLDTSGAALKPGLQAGPYLIKPNTLEAASFMGGDGNSLAGLISMAKAFHQVGVHSVVISAGKGLALFSNGTRVWQAQPPNIEELNPTGAGDAMLAGIIYALVAGEPEENAFKWGIASGAAAAAKAGTGLPSRSEIVKLIQQVKVKEILNAI
jgi:1-phosphofructokinase family hexose kinase